MLNPEESLAEFEWRIKNRGLWEEYAASCERLFRLDVFGKAECMRIVRVQFTDSEVMKHRFDTPLKEKAKPKNNK